MTYRIKLKEASRLCDFSSRGRRRPDTNRGLSPIITNAFRCLRRCQPWSDEKAMALRRNMDTRMLIPLDGSRPRRKCCPTARRLATISHVSVELLGVLEVTDIAGDIASNETPYAEALIKEALRDSTDYLESLAKTFPNGTVRCSVTQGRPGISLLPPPRRTMHADSHGYSRSFGCKSLASR